MRQLVLFDIDGTLLLTGGAGKIAFERAFNELHGIRDAWGNTVPDGKTDPIIFEEIFQRTLNRKPTEEEYGTLKLRYSQCFRSALLEAPNFRLMPGIPELLRLLRRKTGFLLGLATGNFEMTAWLKLERGGIRPYFGFGGFGSDSADRLKLTEKALERAEDLTGEKPVRNSVFVVGDTPHDIEAGKALGLKTVAVATGKLSVAELECSKPDFLFENFSNPREFLKILG
jgi:phosphoglycolate phosphatase-like HAD superfamily hydrolase